MDLSQYAGYLIRRAAQAHVAAWVREVSAETTSVQFGVLASLSDNEGKSQRELGDALDLDRSTIADLVARLERRGLVARRRDERDLRANVVTLTARGEEEHRLLAPRVARMNDLLTSRLSEEEREELARLLAEVLAASDGRGG
ncbi:MarR family transcriptional regulator [Naasia sp. SYSU D00948]|uniref:MarR family transcriptional regulator n=1 Tax=Naasia sp. SYSU D00948 TaxID=2817379 RepID=UPI001B30D015|nr:MarR family transcriptional regulator [Naasia sp. SYSU D00948]